MGLVKEDFVLVGILTMRNVLDCACNFMCMAWVGGWHHSYSDIYPCEIWQMFNVPHFCYCMSCGHMVHSLFAAFSPCVCAFLIGV